MEGLCWTSHRHWWGEVDNMLVASDMVGKMEAGIDKIFRVVYMFSKKARLVSVLSCTHQWQVIYWAKRCMYPTILTSGLFDWFSITIKDTFWLDRSFSLRFLSMTSFSSNPIGYWFNWLWPIRPLGNDVIFGVTDWTVVWPIRMQYFGWLLSKFIDKYFNNAPVFCFVCKNNVDSQDMR